MTLKKLIRYQTCWPEFLLGFNLIIFYILSKQNQKADSLTCSLNYHLSGENNDC